MEDWQVAGAMAMMGELRIGVMNVTSLRPHLAGVLGAQVDVLCLQEVRLTAGGQAALAPLAGEEGWSPYWGAPMPSRKGGIWGAKQGGVAIFARQQVPAKQVAIPGPFRKALWETGRVAHAHIALADGRLVMNIITIYAPQRDSPEAVTFWTKLTEYVATLGTVPLLIAGDYNAPLDSEEALPPQILTEILAGRWVDVDLQLAKAAGRPTVGRYHNGSATTSPTRIDGVMADPRLASTVKEVMEVEDVGLPGHTPLCVVLQVGMTRQPILKKKSFRPLDLTSSIEDPEDLMNPLLERLRPEWEEMLEDPLCGVDDLWKAWTRLAEEVILIMAMPGYEEAVQEQEYLPLAPPTAQRGRGTEAMKQRTTLAPCKTEPSGAPRTKPLKIVTAALGALATIAAWRRKVGRCPLGTVGQHPREVVSCWNKVQKQLRALERMRTTGELLSNVPAAPPVEAMNVPGLAEAADLHDWLRHVGDLQAAREAMDRKEAWRRWVAKAWNQKPGDIYRWLKGECHVPVLMLRSKAGEVTGNLKEMDELLHESWDPVMRKYANAATPEPDPEIFMRRYGHHLQHHDMRVEALTGSRLKRKFKTMDFTTSGLDGWGLAELRALPLPVHDMLADILNRVEETGTWPDAIAQGVITLTPKGEGDDPIKMRPISVLSLIYRAWGGLRMTDSLAWQECWIHPQAQAFRPHRGSLDVASLLALLMEWARVTGSPISGVGGDYKKCFDLVPHLISFRVVRAQGLQEGVARALEGMFRTLRRAFKVNGGLGRFFRATNGILQGCALSTLLVNAVMSVWMREVDAKMKKCRLQLTTLPPRPPIWEKLRDEEGKVVGRREMPQPINDPRSMTLEINTAGYCDDCYALGDRTRDLKAVEGVTDEWLQLTGQEMNSSKSVVFGTNDPDPVDLAFCSESIPRKLAFRSLGVEIVPDGESAAGEIIQTRIAKARTMLSRASAIEGGFTKRKTIVSTLVIATGLYGVEGARTSTQVLHALDTAVLKCIWGPSRGSRAKEVVLHLLLPGHRLAASLYVPYTRILWLAGLARRQLGTMYAAQAI